MTYKYGITGFVKLYNNDAKKYVELCDLYWIKEYSNLLYLWPLVTDNIIKYKNVGFVKTTGPRENNTESTDEDTEKAYCEIHFPRYKNTLSDVKICKDSDIIQIILDLLSAVKLLHEHKIMHRDLKPSNILVNDNRSILIDFSHSIRIRADNIKLDKQVSTYSHRAPEIFKYKKNLVDKYDEKIDIWSIGIILIELITGIPFYSNITDGSYKQIENLLKDKNCIAEIKKYYDNKKLTFKYSNTYWTWIEKMLSYDPINRISAKKIYYTIYKFALCKSEQFIIPTNQKIIKTANIKMPKLVYNDTHLYKLCMQAVEQYITLYKLCLPASSVNLIIKFLINELFIKYNNYHNIVLALLFIIDTVIYDNIININNYNFKQTKIDKINKQIMNIVCTYDRELFMFDIFTFDKQITEPIQNKKSIYNLLPLSDSRLLRIH